MFASAAEAVNAMGLLSKSPVLSEDRLLVSETSASSLLSLAAQIALQVKLVTALITRFKIKMKPDRIFITFSSSYGFILIIVLLTA